MSASNPKRERSKPDPSKTGKIIYVYGEGEKTEFDYFSYFLTRLSNLQLIPIKAENGESDPIKRWEMAEKDFEGIEDVSPKKHQLLNIEMRFGLLLIRMNGQRMGK